MLNVYLSLQKTDKGFPSGEATLKLFKFRGLGTKQEAFADVLSQFEKFVDDNPNSPLIANCDAFHHLIQNAGRDSLGQGATALVNGALLCVTFKVGAECELVNRRGY